MGGVMIATNASDASAFGNPAGLVDVEGNNLSAGVTLSNFHYTPLPAVPEFQFSDELELHLSMVKIKNLCKVLYRKVNFEGITIIATTQNKDFFTNLTSVGININHGRITSVRSKSYKI